MYGQPTLRSVTIWILIPLLADASKSQPNNLLFMSFYRVTQGKFLFVRSAV